MARARASPLDECLRLGELLPRLAFRGDVLQLQGLFAWLRGRGGAAAVAEALMSTDCAGRTALLSAVRGQQLAATQCLLDLGADPNQPMEDKTGDRPLHVACRRNHGALVEVLLRAGADAQALNAEQQSPLSLMMLGATCGGVAYRRARHALREHMVASDSASSHVGLHDAGQVLGCADAEALRLVQRQLDAAVAGAPAFPLHPACELPPELLQGFKESWDWAHCTLMRIRMTYKTRAPALIWLDDKLEQIKQCTSVLRADQALHLPLLASAPREAMHSLVRNDGDNDEGKVFRATVQGLVEQNEPLLIKPRHGANGHGVTAFRTPRAAGLGAVLQACSKAADVDNTRLGENWQLARVPRGVIVQPLYQGYADTTTAPLELKVQTLFGVVIGATLHTHPWQFWVFGGVIEADGGLGGSLHEWCDPEADAKATRVKGAPRKWKKTHGAELPQPAVERLAEVLQADWHNIARVSARLAQASGLDELRIDWLIGDAKWGSRIGELTYIGGAERLVPLLSMPFGRAFLAAHRERLSRTRA